MRQGGIQLRHLFGAGALRQGGRGAAGGLGFAARALLRARFRPGIELV
ncbi:glycerate kinase, partial [Pseudomonas aeruginosa]